MPAVRNENEAGKYFTRPGNIVICAPAVNQSDTSIFTKSILIIVFIYVYFIDVRGVSVPTNMVVRLCLMILSIVLLKKNYASELDAE